MELNKWNRTLIDGITMIFMIKQDMDKRSTNQLHHQLTAALINCSTAEPTNRIVCGGGFII